MSREEELREAFQAGIGFCSYCNALRDSDKNWVGRPAPNFKEWYAKQKQEQHIVDIMKRDEELELYDEPKHLRFDCLWAAYNDKKQGHPQQVMKDLGITYQHATPQTMGDQWWFWNCENIPDPLPEYLEVADWNPMEKIGWGLSKEEAEKIRDYK